jgi:hypothetical protein
MPSTFNANDVAAYDRLMGRWSHRLATYAEIIDYGRERSGFVPKTC